MSPKIIYYQSVGFEQSNKEQIQQPTSKEAAIFTQKSPSISSSQPSTLIEYSSSKKLCKYGSTCVLQKNCLYFYPPIRPTKEDEKKEESKPISDGLSSKPSQGTASPAGQKICKYGADCDFQDNCPFIHPSNVPSTTNDLRLLNSDCSVITSHILNDEKSCKFGADLHKVNVSSFKTKTTVHSPANLTLDLSLNSKTLPVLKNDKLCKHGEICTINNCPLVHPSKSNSDYLSSNTNEEVLSDSSITEGNLSKEIKLEPTKINGFILKPSLNAGKFKQAVEGFRKFLDSDTENAATRTKSELVSTSNILPNNTAASLCTPRLCNNPQDDSFDFSSEKSFSPSSFKNQLNISPTSPIETNTFSLSKIGQTVYSDISESTPKVPELISRESFCDNPSGSKTFQSLPQGKKILKMDEWIQANYSEDLISLVNNWIYVNKVESDIS